MRTIKLVIIGDSGVGKTSIREQYITGRFSTGYRATIGTDFITKTWPHHNNPDDSVALQIWDTAGQERFSSLSAAFFRGADAALLMFDVNQRETLHNLTKWWNEFKKRAPVADEDALDFCVVVVGNKVDVVSDEDEEVRGGNGERGRIAESEAVEFLDEMIPPASPCDSPVVVRPEDAFTQSGAPRMNGDVSGVADVAVAVPPPPPLAATSSSSSSSSPPRTPSIAINANTNGASTSSNLPFAPYHHHHHPHQPSRGSKSKSPTSSEGAGGGGSMILGGTMTTTHTSMTVYHTPSSSLFDTYTSASSSPMSPSLSPPGQSPGPGDGDGAGREDGVKRRRMTSASTSTGSSTPTITPSLFTRRQAASSSPTPPTPTQPHHPSSPSPPASPSSQSHPQSQSQSPSQSASQSQPHSRPPLPPPPETGPALFFTSAKTGSGVARVFEYIATRVVTRWEYEEALEARTMHVRDGTDTIRLREGGRGGGVAGRVRGSCCGT